MADEREEIARAAWVLVVSDDPDFFGQEGAEFWERFKQITAERPKENCASLVNRCYSFADAILARAQGPGEAVAIAAQAVCDALTQDTTGRWVLDAEDPKTLATSLLDALAARLGSDKDPCTLDGVTHDARPKGFEPPPAIGEA